MAASLSPIRAPRQLCGLCFVYRVSDEGDACDSCCSDPPTPMPHALCDWLEEWKTDFDWWPDQFSYELGHESVSSAFAKSWKALADSMAVVKEAYLSRRLTDAAVDDIEDRLSTLDEAATTPSESLRAACIRAQSILELRVLLAEFSFLPLSNPAATAFIKEHLICSDELVEARTAFCDWEMEEMKAALAACMV